MALILKQIFLTGRFHATRWNQNPFEDPYGEWPPSPYRLLRALAARWFEHSRETGDRDAAARDALLRELAAAGAPAFQLPVNARHSASWAARGIKQYQPTELVKSDKKDGQPWVLRHQTTLVVDSFALLPRTEPVLWIWSGLELSAERLALLDALLRRITYFGRAESLCLLSRRDPAKSAPEPNYTLAAGAGQGRPVLVADPGVPLDVSLLLANNDDARLRGKRIPPGACWFLARRSSPIVPLTPKPSLPPAIKRRPVTCMQFALGGRVFPPVKSWIQITEKFRSIVNARLYALVSGQTQWDKLTDGQKESIRLMTGKEANASTIKGHEHVFYWLLPDRDNRPIRLLCYRKTPFTGVEQEALLRAAEKPLVWEYGKKDRAAWPLRLVPLPDETPLPAEANIFTEAVRWRSITPYVPSRHMYGQNGKPKPGESLDEQIARDLKQMGMAIPPAAAAQEMERPCWVKAHMPSRHADGGQTNRDKRGYDLVLTFPEPVRGPLALGHSNHFGLGLFAPDLQK